MPTEELLVYRMNYVDEPTLAPNRLRSDDQFIALISHAATPSFDLEHRLTRVGYLWALREAQLIIDPELDLNVLVVTLARSTLYKRGRSVTRRGIERVISEPNPPLADTAQVLFDLSRHLVGVEYNSTFMYSDEWRKRFQQIVDTAAFSNGYRTRVRLEPVPPRERFESQFRHFQSITRLRATLRIPNPDLSPTFERLYREMQEGGVREFTQDMRNPDGLNFSGNSLPRASLDMALSGYKDGMVHLTGTVNGRSRTIKFGNDVSRVGVEGLRQFVDGLRTGSNNRDVRRTLRLVMNKMDELLEEQRADDEPQAGQQ